MNVALCSCEGSRENGPQRLMCLNTWCSVSRPVREALGGVALEEVCAWG